jgi:hypothetical protein
MLALASYWLQRAVLLQVWYLNITRTGIKVPLFLLVYSACQSWRLHHTSNWGQLVIFYHLYPTINKTLSILGSGNIILSRRWTGKIRQINAAVTSIAGFEC